MELAPTDGSPAPAGDQASPEHGQGGHRDPSDGTLYQGHKRAFRPMGGAPQISPPHGNRDHSGLVPPEKTLDSKAYDPAAQAKDQGRAGSGATDGRRPVAPRDPSPSTAAAAGSLVAS